MSFAPVLTPFVDDSPCPRVEVFFPQFDAATETVTVYRSSGGSQVEVQGAVRTATAGSLSRIDFECPFNVAVSYRAEMFDAAGVSLGFTDATTLGEVIVGLAPGDTLAPAEDLAPFEAVAGTGLISADTWLHNPLYPQGAVKVELYPSTGESITRPVPGSVSFPLGRRVGVMLAEPRQGVRGMAFDVIASDLDTADRVQDLIGTSTRNLTPVICVRLGLDESRLRVPQPLFLGVMSIEEQGIDVRWGGSNTIQKMTGDQVDPPVRGLFVPLLTAADINAFYATATALRAANLTASDVNRRYELAGYAAE